MDTFSLKEFYGVSILEFGHRLPQGILNCLESWGFMNFDPFPCQKIA